MEIFNSFWKFHLGALTNKSQFMWGWPSLLCIPVASFSKSSHRRGVWPALRAPIKRFLLYGGWWAKRLTRAYLRADLMLMAPSCKSKYKLLLVRARGTVYYSNICAFSMWYTQKKMMMHFICNRIHTTYI